MVNINLNSWLLYLSLCGLWVQVISADCGDPEPLLNGAVTVIAGSHNQHLSVIQYFCNEPYYTFPEGENVTFTCTTDGKWRDNRDSSVIPQCIPVCGRPMATNERYQRILGGQAAAENTFPWHVVATERGNMLGAGIVVGGHWVMTTTSLVVNIPSKQSLKLHVGNNNLMTLMQSTPFEVASIHPHPDFSPVTFDSDIALIRLRHPIKFNASVMPVCLPPVNASYSAGRIGLVSGFGRIIEYGPTAEKLQYVKIPLMDWDTCNRSNPSNTRNMICAGLPEGGKDACTGDIGGALVLKTNGSYWAAGIVSWGTGCGQPGQYGFYTKVANYRDWLTKTMQEN